MWVFKPELAYKIHREEVLVIPYIYKITNKLNDKCYIGKTIYTIEKRFKQHIRDSKKENTLNRPLYQAFKKYGIDNFQVEKVEECKAEALEEREKYWIEYYGSFKYGYNATTGGDGKPYLDYDLVYNLYKEGKSITEIVELTNYSADSCRHILHLKNISTEELTDRGKKNQKRQIAQIDIETEKIIAIYTSIADAYRILGKQHSGHIASVCKGQRKTAYGFKWKYIDA